MARIRAALTVRQLRRWPVVAAIVIVLLGGGTAAWALSRGSGSGSGSTQLVAAKVATIQETVSASGTIAPAHDADLDFAVTGRVTHVDVKVGDTVSKGQRLATVAPAALAATKAAAQSTVSADEDQVAEDTVGTTQYTADQAALTAARASLTSASQALNDATLRATIAGTVTTVNLTKGQSVSGGSATGNSSQTDAAAADASSGSSDDVDIQSSSSFVVNATVDDTEIDQVKKGQAAAITPDGAVFPVAGVVTSVSAVPSSSSGVVSFPVTIKVSGHPSGVYAGASATLAITTKKASNVLEIPTLAITYSGSKASVQVDDSGHTTTRAITIGQNYGLETQVLSGISSGEKVVVQIPTFARIGTSRGGEGGTGFSRNFEGGGGFLGGGGGTTGGTGGGGFGNTGGFGGGLGGGLGGGG